MLHVMPALSVLNPQASDQGFHDWSHAPEASNSTSIPTAGTLQLVRLRARRGVTVSSVCVYVTVAGATLTAGGNFAGLYDSTGTRLGVTADQATAWASTGLKSMALTTPAVVADDHCYVGLFWTGTTGPSLARATATVSNANLSAPSLRYATANTGLTTALPATFGAQTAANVAIWAAIIGS